MLTGMKIAAIGEQLRIAFRLYAQRRDTIIEAELT